MGKDMHFHTQGFDRFVSDIWRIFGIPVLSVTILVILFIKPISGTISSLFEISHLSGDQISEIISRISLGNSGIKLPEFASMLRETISDASAAILVMIGTMIFVTDQGIRLLGLATKFTIIKMAGHKEYFHPSVDFMINEINRRIPVNKFHYELSVESFETDMVKMRCSIDSSSSSSFGVESIKSFDEKIYFAKMMVNYCISFAIVSLFSLAFSFYTNDVFGVITSFAIFIIIAIGLHFGLRPRSLKLRTEASVHIVMLAASKKSSK